MNSLSPLGRQRLTKLAEHLEKGQLGQDTFDFTIWHAQGFSPEGHPCRTVGCAIGELPHLFPEEWMYLDDLSPTLRVCADDLLPDPLKGAMQFFDITYDAACHLFTPSCSYDDNTDTDAENTDYRLVGEISQDIARYGGMVLTHKATPQEVAYNIREFLKRY